MLRNGIFGRLLVVALGIAAIGMLAGCSDSDDAAAKNKDSTVTPKEGSTVDATVGTPFIIKLESDPTTGYAWSVKKVPAGVRFISSNYQAPKQNRAGAPGQQLLTFEATKAGSGPVNLVYERPFAADEPGRSLTFSVDAGDA